MTEKQVALAVRACRGHGRTVRAGVDSITVWPQYKDQTPDGGPITFTRMGDLSAWLKAHPFVPVPVQRG